eukprot:762425-Hanusia_phi.AAC.2
MRGAVLAPPEEGEAPHAPPEHRVVNLKPMVLESQVKREEEKKAMLDKVSRGEGRSRSRRRRRSRGRRRKILMRLLLLLLQRRRRRRRRRTEGLFRWREDEDTQRK